MTTTELAYWENQETERANRAKEQENYRSNVAKERETHRSNLANESIGRTQASAAVSQAKSAAQNARTNAQNANTRLGELKHKENTWFWDSAMDLVGNIANPF